MCFVDLGVLLLRILSTKIGPADIRRCTKIGPADIRRCAGGAQVPAADAGTEAAAIASMTAEQLNAEQEAPRRRGV